MTRQTNTGPKQQLKGHNVGGRKVKKNKKEQPEQVFSEADQDISGAYYLFISVAPCFRATYMLSVHKKSEGINLMLMLNVYMCIPCLRLPNQGTRHFLLNFLVISDFARRARTRTCSDWELGLGLSLFFA
jgi:hypothetical protein